MLLTGSGDGAMRLWDLDVAHEATRICTTAHGALTEALWQARMPQVPFEPPC